MAEISCDAVVIGAGPGGYVAAIRLAQLGKRTVLVERENLGGVCLNTGCIPSKALIHAGKLVEQIRHAGSMGINVPGEVTVDLPQLVAWKNDIVKRLTGGIGTLCSKNKIDVVYGTAKLTDARTVVVTGEETTTIKAGGIILATGSRPVQLPMPGFEFDGQQVMNSRQLLDIDRIPKHLAVIGGGVIGLELGQFFHKIGSELTVVEMMDQLLPAIDPELVKVVNRELKKAKARILTKTKATGIERSATGVRIAVETPAGPDTIEADCVLVAVSRRPNTENLGLDEAGVELDERGLIRVNDRLETTAPGVYAIGDIVGQLQLAHKASKEGIVAAESLAGKRTRYDVRAMPAAVFTDPEIATVGMTEVEAAERGHTPVVGRFPFSASGRALSTNEAVGFVKVVSDEETGVILGAGIVGPEASNLIAELALAIEMGGTLEDVALTVHTHPTLPEAVMEACEDGLGHAIHVLSGK